MNAYCGNRKSQIANRQSSGVTLVEVVISIFILTVGVLGIISLFPTGYRLGQGAFDRSVAALAARDALPRVMAELRRTGGILKYPSADPVSNPLYSVAERDRVGVISEIQSSKIVKCKTRGDQTPTYTNLSGYYLVMTSGTASGRVFLITASSGNTLTCGNATFRIATSEVGEPIRVGDPFAIIGSNSPANSRCYPTNFLGSGSGRTIEAATHGEALRGGAIPWEYSYGCVISAPSKEMEKVYRVDVFVYRGFDPTGTLEQQQGPAGHFVTYISQLDDYAHP